MKGLRFLLLFPLIGFSQAEASHWYFGNGAGLIFDVNAGTVTSTNAASGTINTSEGCSSISDFNGNLLFYTDGRNIWDKNHTIMPNANYAVGTGLMGDPSSTSSGLIIPKPGNSDQYYVFTVDEPHHQNAYAFPNQGPANAAGNPVGTYDSGGSVPNADDGFNNGLAYTLVDLSLNAGDGDVVTSEKNIQLTTYDPSIQSQNSYKCSEKITAVEHSDGQSYWVVTHFRDRFYSFRVEASGVNTTAVVTTTTTLISELGYRRNAIGYMKASPDGTKIALCHRQNGTAQGQNSNNTGSVMLYDFDNATGLVSNPTNLYPNSGPYGVEFSQESTKLYVTANQSVIQFDLEAANPAQTINTVYNGFDFIGALQLGPDGKIYVANTDNYATMDVINAPDEAGVLCDYTYAGITLAPGTTGVIGLPPFIQSFFLASIVFENACVDQSTLFDVNSSQDFDSILWTFGDGTGTSNENSPSYTYTSAGTYTVTAEITSGTEVNTFTETIIISENPIANPIVDIDVCDEDGIVSFDFVGPESQILGTQNPVSFNVKYYASQSEAESNVNPLSLPYQNTAASETIFVRIENTANNSCFDTTAFQLTVFDSPVANAVAEFEVCDDLSDGDDANGQTEIMLTDFDSEVIGTQDPALFDVSYHESLAEAQTNTNPLSSPYYNSSPFNYQIFVRLQNNLKTDCFDTTEFTVNVYATPTANLASDLKVCDDDEDGVVAFDFAETQTQILGGQDATNFNLTYHSSLNEAESNVNPLSLPYQNTAASETIFVRIENTANNSCFDTTAFQLTVFDSPVANAVAEFEVCDDLSDGDDANGQTEIMLTDFDSEVIGTQDPALFDVSYHESLAEAQTNTNPLSSPYYNSSPFNYQIFVRLQNNLKTDCFDTTEFTVNVYAIPQALNANLIQCDEDGTNDGLTTFNLSEANATLSGASPDRTIRFYLTFDNAENSTDEITAAGFTNTSNPQTLYAQVIDDNSGCFNISELTLDVSLTSGLDASLTTCDDDGIEDGFALFNLSTATPTILSGLPADYNLEYYETYQDALLEQNSLGQNFTNTIAYNQTIFARIENNNQCYGVNELNLSVFELPQLDQGDETFFCVDSNSPPVFIDSGIIGNPSDFSFLWSSGQTSDEIEISQGGTYTVTVTNANGCTQTKSITIVNSNIATIENIEINDVSANNTVTVIATGEGDYEYALDDVLGPYQDDNTFYNVTPGFHTVYVRDKNNCGIADQIISVIGFPNFFTPNDDGYNDSWHVYGINTPSQAGSKIYIFDRYGKLLKELSYNSLGWDGTYNGNPMPTSDYWFYIELNDNRIFRGHFTLKR